MKQSPRSNSHNGDNVPANDIEACSQIVKVTVSHAAVVQKPENRWLTRARGEPHADFRIDLVPMKVLEYGRCRHIHDADAVESRYNDGGVRFALGGSTFERCKYNISMAPSQFPLTAFDVLRPVYCPKCSILKKHRLRHSQHSS